MIPKAMVTGSTGFIGSFLVESLLSHGWEVSCFIRPKSNIEVLKKLPVRIIQGDIDDIPSLEQAVKDQDYVFHVAARIRSAPKKVYDRANSLFTKNLAQATLKANPRLNRFVYISSIAAAGPSPPGKFSDESQTNEPKSEYGRSKLRGEKWLMDIWDTIPITIIRPPNVYGPRQIETELLIKITKMRILPLFKPQTGSTSLIYIKDLVDGIIQAALAPQTASQIYYLTDGVNYTWRNVICTLKDIILGPSLFLPISERVIYASAWFVDMLKSTGLIRLYFGRKIFRAMVYTPWLFSSAKAEKEFGFKPKYSLQQGMKETISLYK